MTMERKTPSVAIILVNYNSSSLTIACIESLLNITYENYRIIVVDNHSQDDFAERIKPYENLGVKLLYAKENLGFTGGNNLGIEYAVQQQADYILLLNNDTVVEKNFLEPLLSAFEYSPRCGVSIGKIYYEKEKDRIWYGGGSLNRRTGRTYHYYDNELEKKQRGQPIEVTFATGCCLCISRQALLDVGRLDDDFFIYGDDADYSCRVMAAGYKILYAPESVIYHKISSTFGAASPATQRLTARNTNLFIKKNFRGRDRFTAYLYMNAYSVYLVFRGQLSLRYFVLGTWDFLRGKKGKPQWL